MYICTQARTGRGCMNSEVEGMSQARRRVHVARLPQVTDFAVCELYENSEIKSYTQLPAYV